MLELKQIGLSIPQRGEEDLRLLDQVSVTVPKGHYMCIVGPSGCGKTTLLKTIAGINEETEGQMLWNWRDLAEEGDFEPWEIGYVPQFSIAHEQLTVEEAIQGALELKVPAKYRSGRLEQVLKDSGLTSLIDRRVSVLSGGQKRRLGLAMELVSNPKILLCDEVTSGLDPRSEKEMEQLLKSLAEAGRIVISVTHSLANLDLCDSVLVLCEGCVTYHGSPESLTHYFGVDHAEDVYPKLQQQKAYRWQQSWEKHQETYQHDLLMEHDRQKPGQAGLAENTEEGGVPNGFAQFFCLLKRRYTIFFRDRAQVILQLAIIIGFPLLVTLFSEKGKGQIRQLADAQDISMISEFANKAAVHQDQLRVGSAVSGIIMFQVVLLCLMGANNASREIAGERNLMEKERFGGVRISSYLASKLFFVGSLVLAQSLWMAFFVEFFWPFRGDFFAHVLFLILVNAGMTTICLGISACMKTSEQASLLSIYLVGFQLPLSGAVLALPEQVEAFTRPFISAYWAWSGSVSGLSSRIYSAVSQVIDTSLSQTMICILMLAAHVVLGIGLAIAGLSKERWS